MVATKGIELETLDMMTEVVGEELHGRASSRSPARASPSRWRSGQPTAVVAASHEPAVRASACRRLPDRPFRVYTHDDVIGVELGGALKNVMAIASGDGDGLGFGHNTRAALITRGLAEITRLGVALGADPLTFAGLAGMGDLVLTCTGALSRNRAVGVELGTGAALERGARGTRDRGGGRAHRAQRARRWPRGRAWRCRSSSAVHRCSTRAGAAPTPWRT